MDARNSNSNLTTLTNLTNRKDAATLRDALLQYLASQSQVLDGTMYYRAFTTKHLQSAVVCLLNWGRTDAQPFTANDGSHAGFDRLTYWVERGTLARCLQALAAEGLVLRSGLHCYHWRCVDQEAEAEATPQAALEAANTRALGDMTREDAARRVLAAALVLYSRKTAHRRVARNLRSLRLVGGAIKRAQAALIAQAGPALYWRLDEPSSCVKHNGASVVVSGQVLVALVRALGC